MDKDAIRIVFPNNCFEAATVSGRNALRADEFRLGRIDFRCDSLTLPKLEQKIKGKE